jgi:regulatory protein YycH of two-component signal transduction system YycFG
MTPGLRVFKNRTLRRTFEPTKKKKQDTLSYIMRGFKISTILQILFS